MRAINYHLQTKFAKFMFLHVSVCPQVGGIPEFLAGGNPACLAGLQGRLVSQHALQISRPTPRGELEGSGRRGLQAHTQGWLRDLTRGSPSPQPGGLQAQTGGSPGLHPGGMCIPACTEVDPSPSWWLLPQAVRILLECILVGDVLERKKKRAWFTFIFQFYFKKTFEFFLFRICPIHPFC